jgi:hypothetical protein
VLFLFIFDSCTHTFGSLHQFVNGWLQGNNAYEAGLGKYFNLDSLSLSVVIPTYFYSSDGWCDRRTGHDTVQIVYNQSSQSKAARSTTMSESSQSTSSLSPTTSPSSVPSPALSTLSLTDRKEVSDEDRQEAARLKADANKAFLGMLSKLAACLLAELHHCVRKGHEFARGCATILHSDKAQSRRCDFIL